MVAPQFPVGLSSANLNGGHPHGRLSTPIFGLITKVQHIHHNKMGVGMNLHYPYPTPGVQLGHGKPEIFVSFAWEV